VPPGGSLGFRDTAGGFSYGGLAFYELRLIKFVGIEADLAYQRGSFHRKITYNNTIDVTETIDISSLRLPLLAKLNLPIAVGRFWLGAGPEFTLYQKSTPKIDPSVPGVTPFTTRDVKPTFLTMGLGLTIDVPLVGLEIPLEFRASKNLSQPSEYLDRVGVDPSLTTWNVRAESSWVLRLGLGLGYRF
jgi:hypothetical protein